MSIVGDVGPAEAERLILAYSERYMQVVALEILRMTEVGRVYSLSTIRDSLTRPSGQWLCSLMSLSPAFEKDGRNSYRRLDLATINVKDQKRKEGRAAARACQEFLRRV